jgi:agmatine/peptidylarginine deiminase
LTCTHHNLYHERIIQKEIHHMSARKLPLIFCLIGLIIAPATLAGTASTNNTPRHIGIAPEEIKNLEASAYPHGPDILDPPPGTVISIPEWAPVEGVIITWKWFNDFFTDLTAAFVQTGTCWIVVDNASQQASVTARLTAHSIPLDHVEFLLFQTDTCWLVDYAPFWITVDGMNEITDQSYYGRPLDDVFPINLGTAWSIPYYTSDLRIEGGNFMADGTGICFITDQVYSQNEGLLTPEEVDQRLTDYCGCETIHVLEKLNDWTGHIDMFAKLLDIDTIMIGQYEPGDPEYATLETNAATVAGLTSGSGGPYDVVRIPMPGIPSLYWTYTNSLIVNDHVYVPTYSDPEDTAALGIYETAMPDMTIVGINSLEPIEYGGAIHCTTKSVPVQIPTPTPTSTPVNPTDTPMPPTATPVPPTDTPNSPTHTPGPSTPTATATIPPTPSATATTLPSATAYPGTNTPLPTFTPVPPTATNTPPPYTNTPTPPTQTPVPATFTPVPPTATPECDTLGVTLWMPAEHFASGDPCACKVFVCNPDSTNYADIPLFVILDVYGIYFFAPAFSDFDHYTIDVLPGKQEIEVLAEFLWPEGAGSAENLVWLAAMTDPDITHLFGEMDTWAFSY